MKSGWRRKKGGQEQNVRKSYLKNFAESYLFYKLQVGHHFCENFFGDVSVFIVRMNIS